MKALESLWPSEAQVRETLGIDAHTMHEAVFLAVHQPMILRRVAYGQTSSAESPVVSESAVLEALLADEGEGRVIVPIAGRSGAGKSHVIKWLEAELRARHDADKRHVILVPKSSSLKSVLRRILGNLEGTRYDDVRTRLERASESLPAVAAKDLRTRMVAVLQADARAATERIRSRTSSDRRADEMQQWGRDLAPLLEDPELWDGHFYGTEPNPGGVMARLVANVTREGTANRQCQFESSDFDDLVANINPNELSASARRPLRQLADARYRTDAAQVFNAVLDRATQSLLDLGGTPLSEVFLELRRALLEDGKELVILVEDFAVLSGMQGALLDALIHEARVGGRREYCTIRSALAYTEGYQPMNRDTVRTRAGAEWRIEETLGSDDEILERAVALVGAYLNAARWGTERLAAQRSQGAAPGAWPLIFEVNPETDQERDALRAFGRTDAGYPLFPLNRAAIRQLAREKCRVNDALVFNPRLLIDRIVLDVLKRRRHFEMRAFPPESLGNSKVTAPDVTNTIAALRSDADKKRLLTLITYWGELPDSAAAAARLERPVYNAFGLPLLDFGVPSAQVESPVIAAGTLRGGSEPNGSTIAPTSVDPFRAQWSQTLTSWRTGETLPSTPARHLRNYIAEALFGTLAPDWPGARPAVDKAAVAKDHIYLPNVRGAAGLEPHRIAIALCEDEEWNDPLRAGPLHLQLEAVIRFHGIKEQQGTWNWEGGEIAAAHYGAFVAKRRGAFLRWLATQRPRHTLDGFSVANLIEHRLLAAAILGTGVHGGNRLDSAIDILVRPLECPRINSAHADAKWPRLMEDAAKIAEQARLSLLAEVAVYQGEGKKVFALDVAQLEAAARGFMKTWTLSEGPSAPNFAEAKVRRAVDARRDQLRQWRDSTRQLLGDETDKQTFITQIRDVLSQADRHHLIQRDAVEELRRLLARFRDARVAEAFTTIDLALREPPDGTSLASLAYDDEPISQLITELGAKLSRVLDEIEQGLDAALERSGVGEVEAVATQVRAEFDALSEVLGTLEEIRKP